MTHPLPYVDELVNYLTNNGITAHIDGDYITINDTHHTHKIRNGEGVIHIDTFFENHNHNTTTFIITHTITLANPASLDQIIEILKRTWPHSNWNSKPAHPK